MPNYDLGTARGTIEITYDGKGVTQAQQGLQGMRGHAQSSEESLSKVGTAAGVAGGLIAGGLALAVKSAGDFEARLSAIKAVSGNTAEEMDKIRQKALQIGKDTSFSASEAALAMEELAKAGVSTTDILSGAADATVALAAAGEVDLPFAAGIASNAMNQFNLAAKDLPHVADLIAGAANASAIDVKEFGYSLSQVGAVAHLAGLSFDDTSVAIAELGNAGIKGSDAGTSLKTMLMRLQPTTKSAAQAMENLGLLTYESEKAMTVLTEKGIKPASSSYEDVREAVMRYVEAQYGYTKGSQDAKDATDKFMTANGFMQNQFYDQEGKLKSLREIQDLLGKSLQGLTNEEKQMALTTIFGADAVRGAAILANNGSAGFDKLAGSMNKVKAADVAKTRLDNFNGSLEAFKGSAETLAIQMGTVLLPALRGFVDFLSSILNVFLSLPDGVQKFIVIGTVFVGTILLIIAAVIKMKLAFDAMKVTMLALNGTFLANPIVLIIAAIIALVAAIVLAYKNSETFRNIVNAVWAAIKTAIGAVVDWFVQTAWPALKAAWDAIVTAAQWLWDKIQTVWNAIKTVVMTVLDFIVGYIKTTIAVWTAIITTGLNVIKNVWEAIWNTFGSLITAVWNLIKAIINLAIAAIALVIGTQLKVIQTVFTTVWDFISSKTTAIWNAIKALITTVINFIRPYIETAMNFIATVILTVWNKINSIITGVMNTVKNVISSGWNAIKSTTQTIWNAVDAVIGDKIRAIISKVQGMINTVKGFFSGAASWLYNAGRDIIQGLINGITSMINGLTSKLNSLTSMIPKVKGPPEKDKVLLEQNGELIIGGLINGINNMVSPLTRTLQGIGSSIPTEFTAAAVGSRAAQAASLASAVGPAQNVYHTEIYNPLPEPAGESVNKRLQTLSLMGA